MIQRGMKILPLALAALGLAGGLAGGTAGCGPDEPAKSASTAGLPRWEGHALQVFDDNIEPAAVGLSLDGPGPRGDAHLRERAQTADVVARVKVMTVTVDSAGEQQTYHLGVRVGIPTLAEAKVSDLNFELSIKHGSGAYGIARSFDARLRERTFVGFIKRYGTDDGETVVHWHLAPDTAEVVAAVKEAVALRELAK
jgi:hypothetical protein